MALLTEGDIFGLAGVYFYVLAVVAISWGLKDRVENPRKIVHILVGGIVFFWWSFDTRWVMAFLAAFPFVPQLLLATPGSPVKSLRNSVLGMHSSEGHAYGLVFYAISWTIIAYLLFDDLFAASIAIAAMSFGDGMGEVIGKRYGKKEYMRHRTAAGSLAVFVVSVVCILIISWFYFDFLGYSGSTPPYNLYLFSISVGALVAFLEAVTPGSVDNLVIPLVLAGFLHVMGV